MTDRFPVVPAAGVVVAGHLFAVPTLPDGLSLVGILGLEVSVGLVAAALLWAGGGDVGSIRVGGFVVVGGVGGWLLSTSGIGVWQAGALVSGIVAFGLYGIHRYERLTLGLLEDTT